MKKKKNPLQIIISLLSEKICFLEEFQFCLIMWLLQQRGDCNDDGNCLVQLSEISTGPFSEDAHVIRFIVKIWKCGCGFFSTLNRFVLFFLSNCDYYQDNDILQQSQEVEIGEIM